MGDLPEEEDREERQPQESGQGALLAGLEDGQRGDDGHEDPEEEVGHLLDREPAELVPLADRLRRRAQAQDARRKQDERGDPRRDGRLGAGASTGFPALSGAVADRRFRCRGPVPDLARSVTP